MADGSGSMIATVALWVLIPAVIVGLIVLVVRYDKKRRERRIQWAAARGWRYRPSGRDLLDRWQCPPFGHGSARSITSVFSGIFRGRDAVSMSYKYTDRPGNGSTRHLHVVALQLPALLPALQLVPDRMAVADAKPAEGQGLDTGAFGEVWRVEGAEERFVDDVLHPQMVERLLQPDAIGRWISIAGRDILVAAREGQDVEMIDPYLTLLWEIADLIPRHVWARAGYDPGA